MARASSRRKIGRNEGRASSSIAIERESRRTETGIASDSPIVRTYMTMSHCPRRPTTWHRFPISTSFGPPIERLISSGPPFWLTKEWQCYQFLKPGGDPALSPKSARPSLVAVFALSSRHGTSHGNCGQKPRVTTANVACQNQRRIPARSGNRQRLCPKW